MRFLSILLIIIASWYLLGFIGRLLFPFLVKSLSKRMMNNFTGNQNINFDQDKKKEGEVTIDVKSSNANKKSNTDGDYIEYEEVGD